MQSKWPEPAWITALPKEQREVARVRFYLNLAATFASEGGTLTALSKLIGLADTALNTARNRGRVSPETAIQIEQTLGRDNFPRELFNAIFIVGER